MPTNPTEQIDAVVEARCRYCLGGYCKHEDVRLVELRTVPGSRKWDGGTTTAGKQCRIYLRGHIRFVKECNA